ncbi:hypothetical protein [Psychroserpens ponticola]|uniref:DUF4271 domain-containing protein n=1 Tax=Psychroserpens ponticola TaxID=2932268 RepID=A0ABY7RWK3_9FLAO|nr:hypothetical protein [Psychroserpens ponticola]WCO01529.1 hypothetical protein MUN68_015865 [Psychroserpens ponticola]
MTIFDIFFFNVFSYYKARFKKQANTIAVLYISTLQIALVFLLGSFFAVFLSQMNVNTMSSSKAWTLFIIASIFIYFKNWIQYGGKKRKVLNAKTSKNKSKLYPIWLLWLLPIASIGLSIIILQAL